MRKVLRTKPAADYVGLSKSKLEKMRGEGTGPAYFRVGERIIVYSKEKLDAWLNNHLFQSTSEYRDSQ